MCQVTRRITCEPEYLKNDSIAPDISFSSIIQILSFFCIGADYVQSKFFVTRELKLKGRLFWIITKNSFCKCNEMKEESKEIFNKRKKIIDVEGQLRIKVFIHNEICVTKYLNDISP